MPLPPVSSSLFGSKNGSGEGLPLPGGDRLGNGDGGGMAVVVAVVLAVAVGVRVGLVLCGRGCSQGGYICTCGSSCVG
jgi:hypothetical protein